MSISLENYIKIVCNMMYIPIHPSDGKQSKSLIESLHCLFTLYSGFKDNIHFQNKDEKAKDFLSLKVLIIMRMIKIMMMILVNDK